MGTNCYQHEGESTVCSNFVQKIVVLLIAFAEKEPSFHFFHLLREFVFGGHANIFKGSTW